jgi:PRTRC genetic system protein C
MADIKAKELKRFFKYNGASLEDPGLQYSPEEVKEVYTLAYQELTNAVIEGPLTQDNKLIYEFRRAVGSKG